MTLLDILCLILAGLLWLSIYAALSPWIYAASTTDILGAACLGIALLLAVVLGLVVAAGPVEG